MSSTNAILKRRKDGQSMVFRRRLQSRMNAREKWEEYEDYIIATPSEDIETLNTTIKVDGIYSGTCIASLDWPTTKVTETRSVNDYPDDTCELIRLKDGPVIFYCGGQSSVTSADDPDILESLGITADQVKAWENSDWETFSALGLGAAPGGQ